MTEYALAQLLLSWGVEPTAMVGHSLGEYTAACLAGVFSVADALAIVTLRGELFESLPAGSMISIPLAENEIQPYLNEQLAVSVINNPNISVVSGSVAAIEALSARLEADEISYQRIRIHVAAHSPMLDPILDTFRQRLATMRFNPPTLPYHSNVSGTWITPAEATSPRLLGAPPAPHCSLRRQPRYLARSPQPDFP